MHPQLVIQKYEGCEKAIETLNQCHQVNSFNKFLGFCNDAKNQVDHCLKKEVTKKKGGGKRLRRVNPHHSLVCCPETRK
jgi:COX assembly protein 2